MRHCGKRERARCILLDTMRGYLDPIATIAMGQATGREIAVVAIPEIVLRLVSIKNEIDVLTFNVCSSSVSTPEYAKNRTTLAILAKCSDPYICTLHAIVYHLFSSCQSFWP